MLRADACGGARMPRPARKLPSGGAQRRPAGRVDLGAPSHVACRMLHVASCMLHASCRMLHVACCMLHVACCILRVLQVASGASSCCTPLHAARAGAAEIDDNCTARSSRAPRCSRQARMASPTGRPTDLVDLPAGDEDEVAGARCEQQRALGVAVEVPIPFDQPQAASGPAGRPCRLWRSRRAGGRCKAE